MKKAGLLLLMLLAYLSSSAQFSISGELRPRYEFRNGYKKLPDQQTTAAHLVSQRTRLKAEWKNKRIALRIAFQDVRIWGDEAAKKDVAGLGLYEGWAEFGFCDSMKIRVGRQELVYDNQRLLSNNNWQQKAVTHDALLFVMKKKGWQLDVAAAFNQSRDTLFSTDYNYSLGNYKALAFAILSKKIGKFKLSAWGIADAWQKKNTVNTTYLRATEGLTATFGAGAFTGGLRGFYQHGRYESGQAISAYYGSLDATAKFCRKFLVQLGGEWQSGQDSADASDRRVGSFSTLYGTGHSFNGYMDYFTKASDTRYTGLFNAWLRWGWNPGEKLGLTLDLHTFYNTGTYPDHLNGGLMPSWLAGEADLAFRWAFVKEAELQAGYSILTGSRTLQTLAGGNAAHLANWAYIMLTYKPVFNFEKNN